MLRLLRRSIFPLGIGTEDNAYILAVPSGLCSVYGAGLPIVWIYEWDCNKGEYIR